MRWRGFSLFVIVYCWINCTKVDFRFDVVIVNQFGMYKELELHD